MTPTAVPQPLRVNPRQLCQGDSHDRVMSDAPTSLDQRLGLVSRHPVYAEVIRDQAGAIAS
ncbi:hypothetical protein SFC79_01435 [Nocardioides sp. S-58]|uniref:Uncharacterized protein n=1 Tax=Nocardioides renjunii TaxID=3095075 RepID=A0ABU5K6A2_9ACTN|nr:hypothetical protein [Nocardioides sp. S-58]MDZ5660412.1 hypothetical protein [Nocardioides sp. S-58]